MPDPVDLQSLVNMTPRESVDFLRAKGYDISWNWYDVWQQAHARAFTVAKILKMDALVIVRDAVDEALSQGLTQQQFSRLVRENLMINGFFDEADRLSAWRLETIFRTNLQIAYNAGRWRTAIENQDDRPYAQYITMRDELVRPAHRLLHGKVWRLNDPALAIISPTNGFNCRCRLRFLTPEQVESRGLTVENGTGRIVSKTQLIGGVDRRVQGYLDPVTGERLFPDPGFDYNPGDVTAPPLSPTYPKYPPDIAATGMDDANPWLRAASGLIVGALLSRLLASALLGNDEAAKVLSEVTTEDQPETSL